ncbi:MAG: DUF362 domain-containing protein [Nitrospirae bacterium]|nr:MAG: DUF362 domain-containing protein [Nitrospirota bacterium]
MGLMRRELLTEIMAGLGLVPMLAMSSPSTWGTLLFEPEGRVVPPQPMPANPFVREGKVLVGLIHGHDPAAMLREGLKIMGGVELLALRGKQVLIKPNVVNDRPPPTTTNPQVVAAAVSLCREAGAADVLVADSSGVIRFPTVNNLRKTGIGQAAEAAGAKVLALEHEPWVRVEPSRAAILPRYYVSQPVYEADVVINLPVIKTHRFAHYSCSLKNAVGIVHPRNRPSVTFLAGNWHERIAELNLAVHPLLTIADGTTLMIAGGPTSGTAQKGDLLLVSGDRVATDVVALAILRSFKAWTKVTEIGIWEQRQIRHAVKLGLGVKSAAQIGLLTRSLSGPSKAFDQLVDAIRQDLYVEVISAG